MMPYVLNFDFNCGITSTGFKLFYKHNFATMNFDILIV